MTRVDLPCLMMSVQGMTLLALAVKGEAMDASPAGGAEGCRGFQGVPRGCP